MTTSMTTITTMAQPDAMADPRALVRLLGWLSPGFPVGGFAYSHGLENAYDQGVVTNGDSLGQWLEGLIEFGTARSDAALLAIASRAIADGDGSTLVAVADLAATLFGAPELERESLQQGNAFWRTIEASWPHPELARVTTRLPVGRVAYPIAIGVASAIHGIATLPACSAYLHAFAASGVSSALRLGMIGQTEGQRILRRCEPIVLAAARAARLDRLEDVGAAAFAVDLCSLRHETQTTRLFRS